MLYIIMAGRNITEETKSEVPKQLWKVGNETVIGRTIRLLQKYGAKRIAISTNDDRFKRFGLRLLKHSNKGNWINGFYPTIEPTCYIFGDVVFSENAIQTIINTETDSVQFFASTPPFHPDYPKRWAEPFAFKVVDTEYFRDCINTVRKGILDRKWKRDPIAWELWQVVKGTPWNTIDYSNYVAINDFTCDVDSTKDLKYFEDMGRFEGSSEEDKKKPVTTKARYMIHACPKRMWYVTQFLVPSMLKQGIEKEQISIYCDEEGQGNLVACMNAFLAVPDDNGGTWHLQDDVLICKDFKERTEKYNSGFISGFGSDMYDAHQPCGLSKLSNMWWTFPCVRIPNRVARDCAKWVLEYIVHNPVYAERTKHGKSGDDWAYRLYAQNFLKDKMCMQLLPTLVEHIDYLIGGSSMGSGRKYDCKSLQFDDMDLVSDLKRRLEEWGA